MFEVEKPRRFHYEPRFYDPEKEKWEALKKKYAIEQEKKEAEEEAAGTTADENKTSESDELDYFQKKVKEINREELRQSSKLTWMDLFRKREMPKFNYQPRFSPTAASSTPATDKDKDSDAEGEALTEKYRQAKRQIKIRRRFDISDSDYMKPISGTKIMLYVIIVFLLVWVILAF